MALASLGYTFTVLKKQLADMWGVLIIQTRGRGCSGGEETPETPEYFKSQTRSPRRNNAAFLLAFPLQPGGGSSSAHMEPSDLCRALL